MDLDEVVQVLTERGLHARPTPFDYETAVFVSRQDLRFERGDGVRGWRESFVLRHLDGRWMILSGSHGLGQDEVAFSDLNEVVRYAHSLFDRVLSAREV
ncbi:hypothetical protein K8640_19115 [Myxococcus sp. XM-1-1-1]|uniref:hypothetical protein n=1 Tax=Myxococcus TaxID=32 RepID=UPI0011437145|nr:MULTISPECIES: hypothetical protein [Myxococcus]MBZ4410321.1 hypothetical protein [Myxococcus sp. XM-1-1-1]MCK8504093.1 hypothetical protein [Myxococcus fulvus]BDT37231.1 hypothetical protein MFMH1_69000 [Myxococcus sp. MH1]